MRINKFIAVCTGLSRRAADKAIHEGRVAIDGAVALPTGRVEEGNTVTLDGRPLHAPEVSHTIVLNKPVGYVVSREGQGGKTVYDLLPPELRRLKPVGRLDKDSSGLLLLTDNGELAHRLTHPRFQKVKIYEISLSQPLQPLHRQMVSDLGIRLEDGLSKLQLERLQDGDEKGWRVTMHEGRNRQIRRTFASLGYDVVKLHRTHFGDYTLDSLDPGSFRRLG